MKFMPRNTTRQSTKGQIRRRLLLSLLLVAPVLGFVTFSSYGLLTRIELEMEYARIEQDIRHEGERRDSLLLWNKRLRSDTLLIEKMAREDYGMIKPGETVYVLERPD